MGSLLSVIAVTVAANAPAALEGAAVKVRTGRPPIAAADGENDAVTPPGRPLTLSATRVPRRSAGAWRRRSQAVTTAPERHPCRIFAGRLTIIPVIGSGPPTSYAARGD